jgi:hypothetical protein
VKLLLQSLLQRLLAYLLLRLHLQDPLQDSPLVPCRPLLLLRRQLLLLQGPLALTASSLSAGTS